MSYEYAYEQRQRYRKVTKVGICSICGGPYADYGNNAQPINNGRCCGDCNALVVIPRRLGQRTILQEIYEHRHRKS